MGIKKVIKKVIKNFILDNMRSIFILFVLVGMCILAVGYVKSNVTCPPPVMDFKYLDRTFEEQQNMPVPLTTIMGGMFEGPDAWIQTNGNARGYT